jgi:hypothetical protein
MFEILLINLGKRVDHGCHKCIGVEICAITRMRGCRLVSSVISLDKVFYLILDHILAIGTLFPVDFRPHLRGDMLLKDYE